MVFGGVSVVLLGPFSKCDDHRRLVRVSTSSRAVVGLTRFVGGFCRRLRVLLSGAFSSPRRMRSCFADRIIGQLSIIRVIRNLVQAGS